jgi:hypothetical protein
MNMKKLHLILVTSLLTFTYAFAAPEEYGINWTRVSQHQTSNTTWTPGSGTLRINTLVINVSNAGTTWVVTVKNKEGTPKTLYSATLTVGTSTVLALPVGIEMIGGMDVTFSGTAGVADLFATYR